MALVNYKYPNENIETSKMWNYLIVVMLSFFTLLADVTLANPTSKAYVAFHTSPYDHDNLHHSLDIQQDNGKKSKPTLYNPNKSSSGNEICPLQFSLGVSRRVHSLAQHPKSFTIMEPPVIYPVIPSRGPGRQILFTTQYEHLDLLTPASVSQLGVSDSIIKEGLVQQQGFPLLFESSSFLTSPLLHDINSDGLPDAIVTDYDGGIYVIGLQIDDGERYFHKAQVPRLFVRRQWMESRLNEVAEQRKNQQDQPPNKVDEGSNNKNEKSKINDPYHSYFEYSFGSSKSNQESILRGVPANLLGHEHSDLNGLEQRRNRRVKHHDTKEEDNDEPNHRRLLEMNGDNNENIGNNENDNNNPGDGDSGGGGDVVPPDNNILVDPVKAQEEVVDNLKKDIEIEQQKEEIEPGFLEAQQNEEVRVVDDAQGGMETFDNNDNNNNNNNEQNKQGEIGQDNPETENVETKPEIVDTNPTENENVVQNTDNAPPEEVQVIPEAKENLQENVAANEQIISNENTDTEDIVNVQGENNGAYNADLTPKDTTDSDSEPETRLESDGEARQDIPEEIEYANQWEQNDVENYRDQDYEDELDRDEGEEDEESSDNGDDEDDDDDDDDEYGYGGSADEDRDRMRGYADDIYRGDDDYPRYDDYYGGYDTEHEEYYDEKHYVRLPPHILCSPVLLELPKMYGKDGEFENVLLMAVSYYLDEDEFQGFASYKRYEEADLGTESETQRGTYVANALVAYTFGDSSRWGRQEHLDLSTDYSAPENVTLVGSFPLVDDTNDMGAFALGSPTVADIDGDGNYEILVGTSMGIIYAFDARHMYIKEGWPVQMKNPVESRVLFEDVRGDTNLELFVLDTGGNVVCLDHKANKLWHRDLLSSVLGKTSARVRGSSPLTLGDVNGDGILDVVVVLEIQEQTTHEKLHYVFALSGGDGSDVDKFPIRISDGIRPIDEYTGNQMHQKLPQPLLVDLHGNRKLVMEYIRRNGAKWEQPPPGSVSPPPHGGSAFGLHIVHGTGSNLHIIEAGSGCIQSVSMDDDVIAMVQADDVHGTNNLDLVVSTASGNVITLESASPYHPLNAWNNGEVRGRLNSHAHGYSASQGIFVHDVSRQYRDIFGVYVPLTFEIFDNRPNIENEPNRRVYQVDVRDGTSWSRTIFRKTYNVTGINTERLYIPFGPGYYTLSVILKTSHGLQYEDTIHLGYNVHYMDGFGMLLWVPLALGTLCIFLFGSQKPHWDDDDYTGDSSSGHKGILGSSPD